MAGVNGSLDIPVPRSGTEKVARRATSGRRPPLIPALKVRAEISARSFSARTSLCQRPDVARLATFSLRLRRSRRFSEQLLRTASSLARRFSVGVLPALLLFVVVIANQRTPHFNAFAAPQTSKRRAMQRRVQSVKEKRKKKTRPDVIFVATPPETVNEMLRLAELKPGDVLYDLGSGDGRIPIQAAQRYGVRAVGIDIDPALVALAEERARQAGVADRVHFRQADLFRTDISEASVVTLYLSDRLNLLLRPKLLRELRPGTRIISHDFRMGDWPPEQIVRVPWLNLYRTVYVWTVPADRRIKNKR